MFVKNFSSKKLGEPPESKVYETVLEQLNINDADIGDLFVSTYQYFVHRRNAIMHRDKSKRLHGVMEDLIKGRDYKGKKNTSNRRKNEKLKENQLNGNELNLQWKQYRETLAKEKKKGYKIETFDFAKRDISSFILNDLFDIFNFYRLYSSLIDKLIMKNFNTDELTEYCKKRYLEKHGSKKLSLAKFKFLFCLESKFSINLKFTDSELEQIYNGI